MTVINLLPEGKLTLFYKIRGVLSKPFDIDMSSVLNVMFRITHLNKTITFIQRNEIIVCSSGQVYQ